jgi:hypothetical protein
MRGVSSSSGGGTMLSTIQKWERVRPSLVKILESEKEILFK